MPETQVAEKQKTDTVRDLSVQKRAEFEVKGAFPSTVWFVRPDDGSEISPWWSEARDRDLREFVLKPGNDILQGAISSMTKKFKSMNWTLEGPSKTVSRYQKVLAESEFGKGWEMLLGKSLYDYLSQDKGGFWELVGLGDIDGPLQGPVLGIAHLDSQFCQLTGDPVFPVLYRNTKDQKPHKIHATRVVHLVDMPSPNELMNETGFCAVSRVIASSNVLLKLAKYKNEKLDDLPEAGLLILNNILPGQWDDQKAEYSRERRRLGQEIWANIMTMFSLDPAQPATAEFTSFANLPDAFNEREATDLYINIVALAFGVDVREFWPMSAGPLGTASETLVQHQKAKGKGVGDIISTLERAINWKILPPSIEFKFDFRDDEEDKQAAEIDDLKTQTIMSMWRPGPEPSPVSSDLILQMLADNVSYFREDFLPIDVTDEVTATDTDQEQKAIERVYGPRVIIDRKGRTRSPRRKRKGIGGQVNEALTMAEKNYRDGKITAEQIAEFALAELAERRANV